MALVSPGVEVTIIDQSQYLPTASSSVPLLLVATAQNKINAAGTGVAPATTAANANKLYQVTSQRDLVNLYGNPFFYKTTNGTSIQGYELNEYGLQAAYSLMGATNRAYVLRADIDLAELVGTLSRPTGEPTDGTYWLDTTNSTWGIYEFNATTGKFTNKSPLVLTESSDITNSGYPKDTIGNIGDYAVVPTAFNETFPIDNGTYFCKTRFNTWEILGSPAWKAGLYTVVGTDSTPTLTAGHTFTIAITDSPSLATITVQAAPDNTVDRIVTDINALGYEYLTASNNSGKLAITCSAPGQLTDDTNTVLVASPSIQLTAGTGTVLEDLGITPGTYYAPETVFGTNAQMPLWTSSQSKPHPTGSVWVKTSVAGNGFNMALSVYNSALASWVASSVSSYTSLAQATLDIDNTGGKNIPADTVFAQVSSAASQPELPVRFFKRLASGPTVVTGGISDPTITNETTFGVLVTEPNSLALSTYSFTVNAESSLNDFVTAWTGAQINNTSVTITTDGQLQITHTLGGDISILDRDAAGASTGALEELGLTPDYSDQITYNTPVWFAATAVQQDSTNGAGTGLSLNINSYGEYYFVTGIVAGGADYEIGDTVVFSGADVGGISPANDLTVVVSELSGSTVTGVVIHSGVAEPDYITTLSNWVPLSYVANEGAPATLPANGRQWFYSTATQADIMVQKNGAWVGYKTTAFDTTGHPSVSGTAGQTDPLGPIMNTDAPTVQTDGSALVYGDLWIDTNDLENYPMIYRWELVDGVAQWVLIDTADQTSSNGILFADARWATSGSVNPVDDPIPTITSLLSSNYLDLDAPDPALYPQGMLLWNTRRSGYNVKKFTTNYFTSANYPGEDLPTYSYTWVSSSGLKTNGSPYMGRKAQRNLVVQAMKSAIGTNQTIREEDNYFNLISAPGYPELQPDMVVLNNDRNNTAYIIGDTPLRLADNATDIIAWANNTAGATATGEDGWVTRDSYLGVFYPSGITTDYTGAEVVVPASHMMLRTFLRNDTVAYPWFAAAGTRRGTIDNATNIGYIDAATGEFQTVKNRMSIRDVLYTNQINPLAYFTGVGLLNYGNKNSFDSVSALDRTNVARLIAYIREKVQIGARSFVFEPNDSLTRSQLSNVIQSLFIDLVAKRGIYDYLVVCDETNNTPARIDRNELWVDIAIEPVKAAEFIYIPVRIMNTGEIAATGGA